MDRDQPKPERLRFEEFDQQTSRNGRVLIRLVLMLGEDRFTGESTGVGTREGTGRTAAVAAIGAAQNASRGRFKAELVGMKLVRAFDSWIVVTALRGQSSERSYRLLGSAEAPGDDTARGAVLSVLDAVNRVMEKYIAED